MIPRTFERVYRSRAVPLSTVLYFKVCFYDDHRTASLLMHAVELRSSAKKFFFPTNEKQVLVQM